MYLNESINVKDSAIFMGFIRQSLVESLIEKKADEKSINFIMEDAKDCEVLSLAMYGKICPSDNPALAESFLMSNLKDFVIENFNNLPFNENYTPSQFIHEIGGLSLVNTDSMTMIQEGFVLEADEYNAKTRSDLNRQKSDYLQRKAAADAAEASGPGAENSDKAARYGKAYHQATNPSSNGKLAGADNQKPELSLWGNIKKMAGDAGEGISKAWGGFTKFVNDHSGGHAQAIGVTALVGMAAFLGYKAYQNFFSKAARACAGKSGNEKTICMQNVKQNAVKQQLNILKRSMNGCKASANPMKCKQEIQSKILTLQNKAK